MDGYSKVGQGMAMMAHMGKCCMCFCGFIACSLMVAQLTFMIYLAIYAFGNPDAEAWFGKTA